MKKTLSLILAALLCAAMTPAVMAEEVEETPAVDNVVIEEIAADDAGIMLIAELEEAVVEEIVIDAAALVAYAETLGIIIPVEMAEALLAADVLPTAESLKEGALVFGVELTDEAVAAILAFLAPVFDNPADMADTDVIGEAEAVTEIVVAEEAVVEEVVAEEAAAEEAIAEEVVEEEAIVEEVVEEEVSKYPVILEKLPTFGLFTKILSIFTFRG